MMSEFIFRMPQESDIPALAQLQYYMWHEFYTFVPEAFSDLHYSMPQCVQVQEEMITACRDTPNDHFSLIALTPEGELAGISYIGRNIAYGYDLDVAGTDMELHRMYIHPNYRGQHIGSTMMRARGNWAKQQGYRSAHVWTFDENPFCRFYLKNGARVLNRMQRDYTGTMLGLTLFGWDDFSDRFAD